MVSVNTRQWLKNATTTAMMFLFVGLIVSLANNAYAVQSSKALTTDSSIKGTQQAATTQNSKEVIVYRLYNAKTGEHLYTTNHHERMVLKNQKDWFYEGVAWRAVAKSTTPVYRLYNKNSGEHLYTTSANERKVLTGKKNWTYEGIAWYSDDKETYKITRLYSSRAKQIRASHHYTLDSNEVEVLTTKQRGWINEGTAWYAIRGKASVKDGWVKSGSTWEWWDCGILSKNRWVTTAKLPSHTLASSRYLYRFGSNGKLVKGLFKVGGKQYYADTVTGRVARSANLSLPSGSYYADANGVLWPKSGAANSKVGNAIAAAAVALSGTLDFVVPPGKTYDERTMAVPPNKSSKGNWTVYNKVYKKIDKPKPWHAHCGTSVLLAVKWAGADDDWGGLGTQSMAWYLPRAKNWKCIGSFSRKTLSGVELQPGDVLLTKKSVDSNIVGHTCVYVGKKAAQKKYPGTSYTVFESGGGGYWPRLAPMHRSGGSNTEYYVYRCTSKTLSSKYSSYYASERNKYLP